MALPAILYLTALPKEPRYVINLKLPHKQMHNRQGSFFKELKGTIPLSYFAIRVVEITYHKEVVHVRQFVERVKLTLKTPFGIACPDNMYLIQLGDMYSNATKLVSCMR